MKQSQPMLGETGTLLFLVVISAFPPLTTDLYLPALPQMVDAFNTTQGMANLTLSIYFVTYALGLLFWGPLSEKFGRKPILLTGIGIFAAASALCALAGNIESLIVFRLFQAFGSSAVTVVATAIVKDLYDGRERERILATIMSLVIIAPMVAPVIGAILLKVASWRMIFVTLAMFGAASMLITLYFRETLEARYTGSILRSWGRLRVVLKDSGFLSLLGIFSIPPVALMAFLAASSYIYIEGFGFTEQQCSYALAFNALFASFGPRIYMKASKHVSMQRIVLWCFGLLALSGVLTLMVGQASPWIFALLAASATLAIITMRVPGMNLMLAQQENDTGSAVAIIQFFAMLCGAGGMALVSWPPEHLIANLGIIQGVIGVAGSLLWLLVRNNSQVMDKAPESM